MTKLQPAANHSGLEVSAGIDTEPDGVIALDPALAAIWELAAPLLKVRDNDAHTLYALGLAPALLDAHPEADAAVVLPAILAIIDGHDSRREALSIDDAIVKDADKTWRLSPHDIDTLMDWSGLDRGLALRLCSQRVHGHLFTEEAPGDRPGAVGAGIGDAVAATAGAVDRRPDLKLARVIIGEIDPPGRGAGWRSAVRQRIRSAREALLRHPWARQVLESRTNRTPDIHQQGWTSTRAKLARG